MSGVTQFLVACLAFAGATFAQIMSHWLTLVRKRSEDQQKALLYVQALKSDIDYTCIQIASVLAFFENITAEQDEYLYQGDPIIMQLHSFAIEKYQPDLLVHPGLIHRTRYFFSQMWELFESFKRMPTIKITSAGRRYLVAYLRYGISLSIRFERLAARGGAIEDYSTVDDQTSIEHFFKTTFVGGGDFLSRSDLQYLFSTLTKDDGGDLPPTPQVMTKG